MAKLIAVFIVMYSLRGGFLVRPLIIALTLGSAGALLSALEEAVPALNTLAPKVLFPSHADPQVAQVILAAIAASMMTVVSIVFAILLMTLTLASMQFSPRIIVSFARDRVTQGTLGIFLGTFSYCVAALPAARSVPQPFAPVLTVLGAMLLALACVAWLLFFIHHISQAISVNHIVEKIASETEAIIDETMPEPRRRGSNGGGPRARADRARGGGRERDLRLRPLHRSQPAGVPGEVVRREHPDRPAGRPLRPGGHSALDGLEGRPPVPLRSAELRGAFDLGPTRTLQQDVEFGILQIVDIALRAISPAVNDPSTAISCVDQLSRILIRFASREEPASLLYDPPGVLRVSMLWPGFERLVDAAFDQIRHYSRADLAVSLRMLRALGDIASTIPDPVAQKGLAERGRRIVAGCGEKFDEDELGELRLRLATLEGLQAAQ